MTFYLYTTIGTDDLVAARSLYTSYHLDLIMGLLYTIAVVAACLSLASALPQAGGGLAYSGSGFSQGNGSNGGANVPVAPSADDRDSRVVPRDNNGGGMSPSTDPMNPVAHGQLDSARDDPSSTAPSTGSLDKDILAYGNGLKHIRPRENALPTEQLSILD